MLAYIFEWFKRLFVALIKELNGLRGIMTAVSLITFVSSKIIEWRFGPNQWILVIAVTSGIITGLLLLWALFRSFPGRIRLVSISVGEELSFDESKAIESRTPRIGIVGLENVGKTRLKERCLTLHRYPSIDPLTQTLRITAYILQLKEKGKEVTCCLLDGGGHDADQQNLIASESDIVIILLDHNQSDKNIGIEQRRLDHQSVFQKNMCDTMAARHKQKSYAKIFLLLNKKDNWSKSKKKVEVQKWFTGLVNKWQNRFTDEIVDSREYSNWNLNCVTNFLEDLHDEASGHVAR